MHVGILHKFGDVAETIWEATFADLPRMFMELAAWLVGETWTQFGLRLTFVVALSYLIRSLWVRLGDSHDGNALGTVGLFAAVMILLLIGVVSFSSGLWREIRPSWIP